MRAFLLFLSSLLTICVFDIRAQEPDVNQPAPVVSRFSFQIEVAQGFVSGIAIFSDQDDVIKGCMINEFGVSALDFIYDKRNQKLKLLKVMSFLNKWYIKAVLRNDLRFAIHILFHTPYKGNIYQVDMQDDTLSILNTKRNIKYTFSPLIVSPQDTDHDTEE
ncbi:MAG: hypothetical protein ACI4AK_01055 [Lepagella sp.]